jgi:hypothetical protein
MFLILGVFEGTIGAKLKRKFHPEQHAIGIPIPKKIRPNFGWDSGLINASVSVSVSGSRRALLLVICDNNV